MSTDEPCRSSSPDGHPCTRPATHTQTQRYRSGPREGQVKSGSTQHWRRAHWSHEAGRYWQAGMNGNARWDDPPKASRDDSEGMHQISQMYGI